MKLINGKGRLIPHTLDAIKDSVITTGSVVASERGCIAKFSRSGNTFSVDGQKFDSFEKSYRRFCIVVETDLSVNLPPL